MNRKPPSYLRNVNGNADGILRARTILRWPGGRTETRSLGRYGSPESLAAYERAVSEWRQAWQRGRDPVAAPAHRPDLGLHTDNPITIAELVARFLDDARRTRLGEDGTPRAEVDNLAFAMRPLVRLFGELPASEFGPRRLREWTAAVTSGSWLTAAEVLERKRRKMPVAWCRNLITRNAWRVRLVFAWGVAEELIPASVVQVLDVAIGQVVAAETQAARETDEVLPVPEDDLAATVARMGRIARAVVELQLLTGARPGEVLRLRPCDLVRSGKIELWRGLAIDAAGCWVVQPRQHKTRHRGKRRVLLFGPRAQEILSPFLDRAPDAYLFCPREAAGARGRVRGERYSTHAYSTAVARAASRAGVPRWGVNRLRHNAATRLREQFGWEVARIVLGHSSSDTTEIYAIEDYGKAARAMGETG